MGVRMEVLLLTIIVQPTPWTQTTLSAHLTLTRSARVEGLNTPSHTLQNEGPMPENKQEHAATYSLVLRPDRYTVVIAVSGVKDG